MPGLFLPTPGSAALAVLLEIHGPQERVPMVGPGWGGGVTAGPCTLTPAEQDQNNGSAGAARTKAHLFLFF